MLRQKNYLALGLGCVLLLLSATTADNSVYILSKYGHQQQLTSTTLRWLPSHVPNEKQIVIGGFEKISNAEDDNNANQADKLETKSQPPIYVCRAMHNSVWVAGMQRHKEKRCTVTMHGVVHSYDKYELLENADGAARITWVSWNKYMQPPVGAVYANKLLIARYEIPAEEKSRYTHYIGTLSSSTDVAFGNIVYANENGREDTASCGELLVETEPIRYELSAVKLNWHKKHDIKRISRVLDEVMIVNRGTQAANMAEASTFSYNYTIYWGRRHAMLNGLNTTITLINGTSLPNVTWGMRHEENRTEAYNILIFLEPGTGVNVTLRANYTNMEVPYTATLISHYEDGVTTSRPISGYRQEETLFDIKPEFGPIYFLNNYSLVPTTVPPSTTTEPTTTTTIATTKQPQETTHQLATTELDRDENMIVPPKKPTDNISTGMQSDDGGPLSLKNKVEVTYGGTVCATFKSSLLTLPLLLLILHRIT